MDVTKPYKFIGFGAMAVTKPYKVTGFGAMAATKPYKVIGFGAMAVTKPAKSQDFLGSAISQFNKNSDRRRNTPKSAQNRAESLCAGLWVGLVPPRPPVAGLPARWHA